MAHGRRQTSGVDRPAAAPPDQRAAPKSDSEAPDHLLAEPPDQPIAEPPDQPIAEPPDQPVDEAGEPTPRRDVFNTALVGGAVVAGALSTGWPENAGQWSLLLIAAVLGGVAPHTPLSEFARDGTRRLLRRLRPVRLRRLLVGALVVVVAAGIGRSLVATGSDAVGWGWARAFGCADPIEARVVAAPEGLGAARELAATFEREVAADNFGCAAVNLYVYAQPPAAVRAALGIGWSANHLRTLGPRPDLWLPGSTRFGLTDPERTSNGLLTAAVSTTVAFTPIVLAVPADAVPADLSSRRTELTWAEALDAVEALGWHLARPDPARSTAGELATVAMYASGGGEPERLAGQRPAAGLVSPARARELESRIARGLESNNAYPLGGDIDLLCRHRQLGSPRVALIIAEQQLAQFNTGQPLGALCPASAPGPPAHTGLFAVYPADTLSLDFPVVRLDWPRRSPAQREVVERFAAWLGTEEGKQSLNDVGLRPVGRAAGEPLSEARGALPGVPRRAITPSDTVLRQVERQQAAAQRAGRVLLALDASGSMAALTGTGGARRFDVATTGVSRSLSLMTGQDEFGLWIFPGPGRRSQELVPLGPGDRAVDGVPRREASIRALRGVQPRGATPLYRTVVDGVAELSPPDPERANALVVVTDGEERGSAISRAAMVDAVRGRGVRVFFVAVGEANCESQAVREVVRATAGDCFRAGFDNVEARLEGLFRTLWGGL